MAGHRSPLHLNSRRGLRSLLISAGALIAFLLLAAAASARTGSLVSIKTNGVAPLPVEDVISRLLVVDGRPVALGAEHVWILDRTEGQWAPAVRRYRGHDRAVAGNGSRAFLLLSRDDGGPITRVEEFMPPTASGKPRTARQLPPLPLELASAQGALLKGRLFVGGISTEGAPRLLAIDLEADQPRWSSLEPWPGMGASVTSMVGQNSLLLVTIAGKAGAGDRLLQWKPGEGWRERARVPGSVLQGTGRAMGQGHVLYIVKGDPANGAKPRLISYYTITGSWAPYGALDNAATASFGSGWKNGVLWGQSGDHGHGAEFAFTEVETGKQLLHSVDWWVIVVYLLGVLGVGLYFYLRHAQDSEAEFFLGGRSIPFWAAGISLYASNASSISYIAVPAKAFATNWQYLVSNLIVVLGLIFVAIWIVPLLRRLNLMSIFHYLETRFHPSIRLLSSALFIVFQLGGRMTIILFLPSLAIATVTGFDIGWSILIMGGITVIYTVLGGMKAVIWTDVLQLLVMFGGVLFATAFIMLMLDGGIAEFLTTAAADGKMKMVDWSFDLTQATVWGFIFLVIFDTVLTFPKDQVLMQRVLATSSAKEAGRSVWMFAAIIIPGSVMFYLIGTALYAFYQSHPERMDPSLTIDATFPLFIAAELPIGVAGLIIAGIFAASMSTLSSILNSVATVVTVDFYEKMFKGRGQKENLRCAEIVTVVAGAIGIGLALLLTRYEIHSLLDLALELWGLLGGGFAGAYTLGMFTRRANWQGVVIGVSVSIAITLYAWALDLVHPYFYLPVSILVCIVVGYAASFLFPAPRSLQGLTIYRQDTAPPGTVA